MYKQAIAKLLGGVNLTREEAAGVMTEMMEGALSGPQIGAFLAALSAKGESAKELAAFASVMRERALKVSVAGDLMDTCGTGGSGLLRPNTSTLAAFILAASGLRIAKHGNRASSGQCGSMDVLEALGIPIDLGPAEVEDLIGRCGIGFMFAPRFHPAMKNVAAARREVGFRTTFNLLGPLSNPAGASMQVIGVSDRKRAPLMIEALQELGSKAVMVATGEDGLDEITLTGPTDTWILTDGGITRSTITPALVGTDPVRAERLAGGDPTYNARIFAGVVEGSETGPIRDLALINAAAGLLIARRAASLREGFEAAKELLVNGAVLELFRRYRDEARRIGGSGAVS